MQRFKFDVKILVVLLAIRKMRDYSQLYVANVLGINRSTYSKLENGKATITSGKLIEIARILNTSVSVVYTLASSIDNVEFETQSVEQIENIFLNIYLPRAENFDFTSKELRLIFNFIKRFYPKLKHSSAKYSGN